MGTMPAGWYRVGFSKSWWDGQAWHKTETLPVPVSNEAESGKLISSVPRSTYLGGLPDVPASTAFYTLAFHERGVRIGTSDGTFEIMAWSDVKQVRVDGGQVAKSRVANTVLWGVAALGGKSTQDRSFITFYGADGVEAYVQCLGIAEHAIRAQLSPILRPFEIPFADEAPVAARADDPIAMLRQLAQLRDEGIVTPEEFEAKKTDLLGRL